jgi:hypothetical protein
MAGVLVCAAASAQTSPGSHDTMPQIPFGQTYKDFQFPVYQKGQLAYTFTAVSATGITINRADATEVKIDVYTDNKVTTTITSPRADIYVADRKMRSKNTVKIERADLEATSQVCDFDLLTRKFLLRQNVRVVLKNFDVGAGSKTPPAVQTSAGATPDTTPSPTAAPAPAAGADSVDEPMIPTPGPSHNGDSLIDVPGAASATTNAASATP